MILNEARQVELMHPKVEAKLLNANISTTIALDIENIEISDSIYHAELRDNECFSLGRDNCNIYIDTDKMLKFICKDNVIYLDKGSDAFIEINKMQLFKGLEFRITGNQITITKALPDDLIFADAKGISYRTHKKHLFDKKFGNTIKIKMYPRNGA